MNRDNFWFTRIVGIRIRNEAPPDRPGCWAPCMWPPRRSSTHELALQKEVTTLQLKLLRANSALAIKTQYASRLEFLLHERLTKIDELTGTIDQQRERIRRLGVENEILTAMIAAPPVEAGSLRAELLREIKP